MNPILVLGIIALTGLWMYLWRGQTIKAPVQAATLGGLVLVAYFVFAYQRDATADLQHLTLAFAHESWERDVDQFDKCIADVDRAVQARDESIAYEMGDITEFTASLKSLTDGNAEAAKFADDLEVRRLSTLKDLRPPLDADVLKAECVGPGTEPPKP